MGDNSHSQVQRKSPVSREFLNAKLREVEGQNQPWRLASSDKQPALFDFSLMPRFGVRGTASAEYLQNRDIPLPTKVNEVIPAEETRWVARLGMTEYWVIGASGNQDPSEQMSGLQSHADGCYPVPCDESRAWFVVDHPMRAEIMAKLCGVDLRDTTFALSAIAQTSVARVNAIVMHHSLCERAVFSIFSDTASASYLWHALLDALEEYGSGFGALADILE
ncbi:MAG: sarcosine oxidase [Pseudomonadota bacterium]